MGKPNAHRKIAASYRFLSALKISYSLVFCNRELMIFPRPATGKDELEKLKELPNSLFAARANVSAKISRYEDVRIATSRSRPHQNRR